jgi:hypothetical protein
MIGCLYAIVCFFLLPLLHLHFAFSFVNLEVLYHRHHPILKLFKLYLIVYAESAIRFV